ncbi:MAG TPA: ATP-binding protein [Candidatus Limnocylindrales bacterium]
MSDGPAAAPRPEGRPGFIDELSRAHYARLARCIVLTGNTNDLFPIGPVGQPRYVSLEGVLADAFGRARYPRRGGDVPFVVLSLKANGIAFASAADRGAIAAMGDAAAGRDAGLARDVVTFLREIDRERSASIVTLTLVAELLRLIGRARRLGIAVRPLAAIVDHAETLLPAGDVARLAPTDREAITIVSDLLRDESIWAEAATADAYPDVLILIAPTVAELSARIAELPKTGRVDVPRPGEATRRTFVTERLAAMGDKPPGLDPAYPVDALVADAKGLTLRDLDDLLTAAQRSPDAFRIDRASVVAIVNRTLQERLGSIITVVYPEHTMADVVGFSALKVRLDRLRRRFDDPERAPAGITVVGPNGAGKTYILEAFARETDRTVITLGQIRSEWYGKTDVFAEAFSSGVAAFGRILILVDEAHVAFGSMHDRDTHETEARLASHMIRMIDDLPNRGRIVWALITTRPDLLDPDFVRSGRCSLFVPIFDPEGADAAAFAAFMERRLTKAGVTLSAAERRVLAKRSAGFSAGDYREFADDFADERAFDERASLAAFIEGWTPSSVSLGVQRELQILLAALHCDWPELLPERLRGLSKAALQEGIDRLRASALLG